MPHVIIVGAGISGLSLAYRLQERGIDVTVLESRDRVGGTIWTHREDGFQVEGGPNGFLDNKPSTLNLCARLGIDKQLVPATPAARKNRFLFLDGRLRKLPGSLWAFLTSDLLSWRGKLSLMTERWRRRQPANGDESIQSFAERRTSAEVARVFADALVTGIYAGEPTLLSARACFPRLTTLEAEHGSVLKGLVASARQRRLEAKARGEAPKQAGAMWSFPQGLRWLVENLATVLKRPPILGVRVRRIQRQESTWTIHAEGRDAWSGDAVIVTCPAYQQSSMLADLDAELAESIGTIPYNRLAVIALGYRRADVPHPLDGFGYIAPQSTRRDVLGVQWCSSIYPERAPAGMVLLRAMCGGWHRADVAAWDDARLLDAVRKDMRQAMGISAEPVFHKIIRWERAIPQYLVGHLDRVAWIESRLRRHAGLFLGGNAYHGVSLNDCTEQAEVIAARVQDFLASRAA